MEYDPTVRALVEYVATPLPFSVPVPNWPEASAKLTVPVGVTPAPVTAAVKVTEAPAVTGLGETVRETLEVPWPAYKVVAAETLFW
jgi:hypothetical protein